VVPPKGTACRLESWSSAGERSHTVMAIWADAGRFAYVTGSWSHSFHMRAFLNDLYAV
jgi:hypothetical protein